MLVRLGPASGNDAIERLHLLIHFKLHNREYASDCARNLDVPPRYACTFCAIAWPSHKSMLYVFHAADLLT